MLLLGSCSSCGCSGSGSSSSSSPGCFRADSLQASKSCSLGPGVAGSSEPLKLSPSRFLDFQDSHSMSPCPIEGPCIGPTSSKSCVEPVPALSLGPCDVSLSNLFQLCFMGLSHFHDVAPLGPPGVVDSASTALGPAGFNRFVIVNCSLPSDCHEFLSSNGSCSLCGCGSLCCSSFIDKPLFSQIPSISRSPELD